MQRRRWYMVSILSALYVAAWIDRLIVALMVEPIKAEFGLTDTQMGLLIGPAFAVFFALAALPAAWAVDRGNRKTCLVLGVVIWSACTGMAAFATSFAMLLTLRVGLAIGEAVLSPIAASMIGDLFARGKRAMPSAVYVAAGMTGVTLAYVAGGAIIQLARDGALAHALGFAAMAPWRLSLLLVSLPGLVLVLLVLFTTREPAREPARLSHDPAEAGRAALPDGDRFGVFATRREMRRFYSGLLLGNGVICLLLNGTLAWYPTYLMRAHGLDASSAGYIFSTAVLGSMIPLLAIAFHADRISSVGRKDLLLLVPLVQIPVGLVFFILAIVQSSLLAASIFMALGYSLLSAMTGLPLVCIPATAPPAIRGRLAALNMAAAGIIGAALGTFLVGFLSDSSSGGATSLGTSLLVVGCVAGPLAWLLFALAWKPFRDAMYRRADPA